MGPIIMRCSFNIRKFLSLLLLFFVMLAGLFVYPVAAQNPQPGLANGFEIDGNVIANNPWGIGLGLDWVDGTIGPGIGVLNSDYLGTPKDPLATIHIRDLTKNDDLDIFAESNKVFDNPNNFTWKAGSVPQKDDIQNGLVHFTIDEFGAPWIAVAGDRRAVNGDSYIDFEFLQSTLVMNTDGTFTSGGLHGGRTLGDMLLTIKLTKGGSQAIFSAQRWEEDGGGGYTYIDVPIPTGAAFVAANIDSQITSSYDAFGGTTYDINQFGEGAVNLEALLSSVNECVAFATLFIRTKSSKSADAELKDFIKPINVNVCIDKTAPEIIVPNDIVVSCDQSIDPLVTGTATGVDDCSEDVAVSFVDTTTGSNCETGTTILRTWTATDNCGNSVSGTQVITIVDETAPEILSGPEAVNIQCVADIPPVDAGSIVATDACGNVTVIHVGDAITGSSCDQVITRTYRASDECGNSTEFVQIISIKDTTPPIAETEPDCLVQCIDLVPEPETGTVTASDNCGSTTVTWVSDVSDGNSCPEVITRTYRVTDACGNVTDVSQKITIHDTIAPEVSGPEPLTVDCVDKVPNPDILLVSGVDNCGSTTVTFIGQVSDGNTCPEVITRTYRVTDDCGNATDFHHVITINDTIPPVVSGPEDVALQCVDELPAADINLIVASDNCGEVTVVHVGDVSDNNTCDEVITRTYRASDACNNSVDYLQVFTIRDTKAPQITCPENIVVEIAGEIPPADPDAIDAEDNCGSATVIHVGDFSDNYSCPETIQRVYRATDACGNYTECTQTIIVNDVTPPVITGGPKSVTIECYTEMPLPSLDSLAATDNSGISVWAYIGDESNGEICPTVITRTYRVSDPCGNSADYVQVITVHDQTPPLLSSCGVDQTIECPDGIVFNPPTATDNCDPSPIVYTVGTETTVLPWQFIMKRTWAAADQCGNVSTECSQTITAECEAKGFCTFTQGFYGNYGGYFNGESTIEIITRLLEEPLVVGKEGRSLTIDQNAADCIITRLPGGTTPKVLPEIGDANLNHKSCQVARDALPVDSEGKFENVLLSQTITLSLNTRYNFWLVTFPLSTTFYTADALPGPDGLYGTGDDIVDPDSPIGTYHINEYVLNALTNLNLPVVVHGLLELANRALAGLPTGGASLAHINDAVDVINNAFNGCRMIVDGPGGENVGKEGSRVILTSNDSSDDAMTPDVDIIREFKLEQNYPNPFNPTTQIVIAVPHAERWVLVIYNVAGQLVRRFEGVAGGPERVMVTWDGSDSSGTQVASGVYLYRVQAGTFVDVKRMVFLK